MLRPLCLILFTTLAAIASAAPSTNPTTNPAPPPPRPPDKILSLPNVTEIRSLMPAHQGSQVYAELTTSRLNISRALASLWPEFLGLLLLLTLYRLRKRLARRVGHDEFCRKCEYQLTGLPSNTCPECGTSLSPENRLAGRPSLRRFVCLSLFLIANYILLRPHLPRQFTPSRSLTFYSAPLAGYVNDHPRLATHASQFIESHREIALIEIPTGRRLQTIGWSRPEEFNGWISYISPDGKFICNATQPPRLPGEILPKYMRFERWEVATGRVLASANVGDDDYPTWPQTMDGKIWLVVTKDLRLIGRDLESTKPHSEIQLEKPPGSTQWRFDFAQCTSTNSIIAWAFEGDSLQSNLLCEWNFNSGRQIRVHHFPNFFVPFKSSREMPDRVLGYDKYSSGTFNFKIRVLDMQTNHLIESVQFVFVHAMTPDGKWLITQPILGSPLLHVHRLPPPPTTRPTP